ncbi:ester cyclase [Epibacterium ulvae]|uniref:ester cyclase n=1 Tax=Epibacterium ulvae TaxID=1156985 RepID=UPI00249249FD|nr:ester cyclase [Epibacterium ulvae]
MTATNKELLETYLDEVWCKGNTHKIKDFLAIDHDIKGTYYDGVMSIEDLTAQTHALHALVQNPHYTITHVVEQEDTISIRALFTLTAVHNTGHSFTIQVHLFMRAKDGKIAELSSLIDMMSLFEHLGQLPSDVLPICMTGQKLRWAEESLELEN